jgi:S-adenosylmethionine:tRNA ribosyltransferase-isomerase
MEHAAPTTGADTPCLPLSDFAFPLPPRLIAQEPTAERTAARLLVWDRAGDARVHAHVADLPRWIRPGDVFVFNDTKVIPARLYGRTDTGAAVELLVLRANADGTWRCLGRPGKRLRLGARVTFAGAGSGAAGTVAAVSGDGRFDVGFDTDVFALLSACGEVPLPPYIKRPDGPMPFDRERYQTTFAHHPGAVAAPTAGLHFTPALLDELRHGGAEITFLTLHVGPGTFLPVRVDDLADHTMEDEWCAVPTATAALINRARAERRRVIAVGTTATRALESSVAANGELQAGAHWADRFIRPGDRFRVVDALFTNFHLPESTLLALVCAFAGRERTLAVYAEAVRLGYRFYSYGDAMFIQ